MRSRYVLIGLIVVGVAVLIYLLSSRPMVYALGSRNLEMVFKVTDSETGEPIANAMIELTAVEYRKNKQTQQITKLVPDNEGRAKFVHENNRCEDIIRLFRRTETIIDLNWASVNVLAKGYSPIAEMWLSTADYEDKGFFSEGRFQRVEFNLPLHKRADH